jgi:hypothetical protein
MLWIRQYSGAFQVMPLQCDAYAVDQLPTLPLQCWNLECELTDRALPSRGSFAVGDPHLKVHGRPTVGIDVDRPGADLVFVRRTQGERPDLAQRRLDRLQCLASASPDVLEEPEQGILRNLLEQGRVGRREARQMTDHGRKRDQIIRVESNCKAVVVRLGEPGVEPVV